MCFTNIIRARRSADGSVLELDTSTLCNKYMLYTLLLFIHAFGLYTKNTFVINKLTDYLCIISYVLPDEIVHIICEFQILP